MNMGINRNRHCLFFESLKFKGYVGVQECPVHPDSDQDKTGAKDSLRSFVVWATNQRTCTSKSKALLTVNFKSGT